jgi:hypothetical protein
VHRNRVGGLNSGGSPSTSPMRVSDDKIGAEDLDYRKSQWHVGKGNRKAAANDINWRCAA